MSSVTIWSSVGRSSLCSGGSGRSTGMHSCGGGETDAASVFMTALLFTGSSRRSNNGLRTGGSSCYCSCSCSAAGRRKRAAAFHVDSTLSSSLPFTFAQSFADSFADSFSVSFLLSRSLPLAFTFALAALDGLPVSGGGGGKGAGFRAFELAASLAEEEIGAGAERRDQQRRLTETKGR